MWPRVKLVVEKNNEVKQKPRCEAKHPRNGFGRQHTASLPTRGRLDNCWRDGLRGYSKHALYMFWRLGLVCNHFFLWCYAHNEWPQPDPPRDDTRKKTKGCKHHNQMLFRTRIKVRMLQSAEQKNWEQLDCSRVEERQHHALLLRERTMHTLQTGGRSASRRSCGPHAL